MFKSSIGGVAIYVNEFSRHNYFFTSLNSYLEDSRSFKAQTLLLLDFPLTFDRRSHHPFWGTLSPNTFGSTCPKVFFFYLDDEVICFINQMVEEWTPDS